MRLTTVDTILIVSAADLGEARTARAYIEARANVTIYAWIQDGYDNPASFRAALDTSDDSNPINFRAIALALQNMGINVAFHAG